MAHASITSLRRLPVRPELIGRERERIFLHEELAQSIAGHGRLVLLSGEAGIGKTTLARDLLRDAAQASVRILTGHCHDLISAPPYGPWLDLALGFTTQPDALALPAAFAGGQLNRIASQAALFSETLAFLTAICQLNPVLVLLEDLHWADVPSLELLRFLAARCPTLPILFLVTYREDELTRKHPLYQQLPGLVRAGAGLRLDIKRLDAASMRGLVRFHHNLPPDDEGRLCDYLEHHSEGNPFFAVELMRALEEEHLLTPGPGGAQLGRLDRIVLPSLITQVIDVRLERLGEVTRKALSIAAVIGQEVPLDLWGLVAEIDEESLLVIVEEAIEAHLLEADRSGMRVRFVHALTRVSLYESTFPPRRRSWHRMVADALIARPFPDPDAIGFHLLRAGDDRAATWLTRAGDRAQRAYTWIVAADRFIAAANALELYANAKRERGWLLFRAARALRLSDPVRGLPLLQQARQLAAEAGDQLLAADAHYSMGLLFIYTNHYDAAVTELMAGIGELESLPPDTMNVDSMVAISLADSLPRVEADADHDLQASIDLYRRIGMHHRHGGMPWMLSAGGHLRQARNIAETYIAGASELERPGNVVQSSLGHAYQGLGITNAASGDPGSARAAFDETRTIYRGIDHDGLIALCCLSEINWVALVYGADDPAYRRQRADEATRAFENAGGAMQPGLPSAICRVGCLTIDGAWNETIQILSETPPINNGFFAAEAAVALATISLHRGEYATTGRVISEWFPNGPAQRPGSRIYLPSITLGRIAAELALAVGDHAGCEAWLKAMDGWLSWSGHVAGVAESQLGWGRYYRAIGAMDAAVTHAEAALTLAAQLHQPLILARAHRLRGELGTMLADRASAEEHLVSAAAIAGRCAAPYERALTAISVAELRVHERRFDEAIAEIDRIRPLLVQLRAQPALARLEAIPTKPETSSTPLPFGLTAREAEVLELMAQGLTDAAIAERLFISPRTASQHLRSVYAKINVSSRAAATRFAIEHGLG